MIRDDINISNGIFFIYSGLDNFSEAMRFPSAGEPAVLHDNCLTVRAPVESGSMTLEVRTPSDEEEPEWAGQSYVLEVEDGEVHIAVLFLDVPGSLQNLVVEPGLWDVTIGRARDSDTCIVVGLAPHG